MIRKNIAIYCTFGEAGRVRKRGGLGNGGGGVEMLPDGADHNLLNQLRAEQLCQLVVDPDLSRVAKEVVPEHLFTEVCTGRKPGKSLSFGGTFQGREPIVDLGA